MLFLFFRDSFGGLIETVVKAVRVKKKRAFEGVRSGKSKKLWIKIPQQPANAPTAVLRRNESDDWRTVCNPCLKSRRINAATQTKPIIPASAKICK